MIHEAVGFVDLFWGRDAANIDWSRTLSIGMLVVFGFEAIILVQVYRKVNSPLHVLCNGKKPLRFSGSFIPSCASYYLTLPSIGCITPSS